MRKIHQIGRSNILSKRARSTTSQLVISQEAIDSPKAFWFNGKLKVEKSSSKNKINELIKLGRNVELVDGAFEGSRQL